MFKFFKNFGVPSYVSKSYSKPTFNSAYFATEATKGKRPEKVADKIVWINIRNRDNFLERIAAFPGETLLTALHRFKVRGIDGTCEGGEDVDPIYARPIDPMTYGPMCGTCQIVVHNPWFNQLDSPHKLEEKLLLDNEQGIHPNLRLACSIVVDKWMNEMTISIAPNTVLDAQEQF